MERYRTIHIPSVGNYDTLSLFTDASGFLGYGGFFQNRWFQGQWLPCQQLGQPGISSLWHVLYAINFACHLWGVLWTSKRIQFYCDNQAASLPNTMTNLYIALYCILLYCVVLNCIVLLIYCYLDIIQYNAMHKIVRVLDNPLRVWSRSSFPVDSKFPG